MMNIPLLFLLLLSSPAHASPEVLAGAIRLYESGEFRSAVDLLSQMSRSSPSAPEIRLWLGKSYLKVRDWDNSVRELEKAVELDPSNATYHLWLGRACGARASHSVFFRAVRWAGRVAREFETATRLSPDNLDARFDLLDFYIHAPGFVGGGKDKAEAQAKAIAKMNPKRGYVARAMIFEKAKNWEMAGKELTDATRQHPEDADVHKDLADFLLARKDYAGALECARRALALNRESRRSRLILAASKIRLQMDLEEAGRILRELAAGPLRDDDPAFEEVYGWLGEFYLASGDKAKAREAFTSALAFNSEYEPAKTGISRLK
jgi:tetratricopeptide (TPR) repeat protein